MNDTEKIIFEKDLKLDIKDFNNKLSKAVLPGIHWILIV